MAVMDCGYSRALRRKSVRIMLGGRWALIAVLGLFLGLAACKTTGSTRGGGVETKPPIRAENVEGQRQFDRGLQALKEGDYAGAAEYFRLVQADYAQDPIATLAELYIGRALMGAVDPMRSFTPEATQGYAGSNEAAQILAALGESESVDERIRFGAQAYFALEMALRGDSEGAFEALANYPSASLGDVVIAEDQLALRGLLLEAFWRAGRDIDTIEASARLYQSAAEYAEARGVGSGLTAEETMSLSEESEQDHLGAEAQPELEDPQEAEFLQGLKALARHRAFSVAQKSGDSLALQDYLGADEPFLRAIAGWRLLERSVEGDLNEKERADLEDLFNQLAPDMIAIGATSRAAELSQRLAAVGGPKRLAIGFLLPLSGAHQAIGERAMAGALIAMRAFYYAGQPEVTLIFEDSQADPQEVFERLAQNQVMAVVGPLDTQRARAFAPAAAERQIPLITLTTESARPEGSAARADEESDAAERAEDAERAAGEGGFVFRNFIDAAAEARAAARIAFERMGDRRAAVVYPDIGYGRVTSEEFIQEFQRLGGQIVREIPYDRTKNDFAPVAKRLAQSGAQAVFVPDSAEKVAELSAFFANENIWGLSPDEEIPRRSRRTLVHYLGTSLWENPLLVRQAASYVEGATIPVWYSAAFSAQPEVGGFVQEFEATFGHAPDEFAAFSYDTVGWLRELILERGMRRPVAIRDALLAGGTFRGATGQASMDARGDAQRALRFVTPTEEGFVPLPFNARTTEHGADTAEGAEASEAAETP